VAKKKPTPPQVKRPAQRPGSRGDARRQKLFLYGAGVSGIVVLAVVVIAIAVAGGGGSSSKDVAAAFEAAGCTFETVDAHVPNGQPLHVASLTADLSKSWNTFPPSNGQHYPQWAVWDFYTEAVNPRMVVHNEEHGGVVYWWGTDVPASTVDALRALYQEQPVSVLGTPLAGFGGKIAVTAWTGDPNRYGRDGYYGQGHVGICTTWNDEVRDAFRTFRDAYRGHGPEGIPMSQNQPGTA
jgi:hypothetical protein